MWCNRTLLTPNLANRAATASALLVGMNGASPAKLTPKNRIRRPLTSKCPSGVLDTRSVVIGELSDEKSVADGVESFQGKTQGTICA